MSPAATEGFLSRWLSVSRASSCGRLLCKQSQRPRQRKRVVASAVTDSRLQRFNSVPCLPFICLLLAPFTPSTEFFSWDLKSSLQLRGCYSLSLLSYKQEWKWEMDCFSQSLLSLSACRRLCSLSNADASVATGQLTRGAIPLGSNNGLRLWLP